MFVQVQESFNVVPVRTSTLLGQDAPEEVVRAALLCNPVEDEVVGGAEVLLRLLLYPVC